MQFVAYVFDFVNQFDLFLDVPRAASGLFLDGFLEVLEAFRLFVRLFRQYLCQSFLFVLSRSSEVVAGLLGQKSRSGEGVIVKRTDAAGNAAFEDVKDMQTKSSILELFKKPGAFLNNMLYELFWVTK